MWALCQASIIRAQSQSLDADAIAPLLTMVVVEGGALAEQRFHNHRNYTPLQMFAMAGALQCVNTILKYGGSTRTLDDDGWSPLLVACAPNGPCSGKNSRVVELLIKAKADVNHHTRTGLSALAAAAQSNDFESVKLLLAAGASVHHRCDLGFSPIIWAKLGSDGKTNESVLALLDHVNSPSSDDKIRYEMQQDLVCFDLGKLLNVLTRIQSTAVSSEPDSVNALLCKAIMQLLKLEHQIPADHPSDNQSFNFREHLIHLIRVSFVPDVLTKRWLPKLVSHEDPDLALSSASALERHWKKIVESSFQSTPEDSDENSSLITAEGLNFFLMAEYRSFQGLVINPISEQFGHVTMSADALAAITSAMRPIVMPMRHYADGIRSRVWDMLKARSCDVSSIALGLWEEDTVDVALAHLSWLEKPSEDPSSLPLLVIDVESWLLESSILQKLPEHRYKMFQSTVEIIIDQVVDSKSDLVLIGMRSEQGAESLLQGVSCLIHELTTAFLDKLGSSSGCRLLQRYPLQSWPFEACMMLHYTMKPAEAEAGEAVAVT
jgi:hypothetical protein